MNFVAILIAIYTVVVAVGRAQDDIELPLCPVNNPCKPPALCILECRPRPSQTTTSAPQLPLCPENPKPNEALYRCQPRPTKAAPKLPWCPEKPLHLPKGVRIPIPCRPRPATEAPKTTTESDEYFGDKDQDGCF